MVSGADGLRRTELVTAEAVDRIDSPAGLMPLAQVRRRLVECMLAASVIPARLDQRKALEPILEAFLAGLGEHAQKVLSNYMDRAAAGLIQLITDEQRSIAARPTYDEVVEVAELRPVRTGRPSTSKDRFSSFKPGVGYEGYKKSLYSQDWFDSSTERAVANILDNADEIRLWVRLQRGDLPILWTGSGREYNPDFVAVESDETHWIVEVKADRELASVDVQSKCTAAVRWVNHVNASEEVVARWRYLLASETAVSAAKGSWEALKRLGA